MKKRATLLSLFAGAGGLDIGLELAGFTTLVVNELEPHACETLRRNKELSLLRTEEFELWFAEQIQQRCYEKASDIYLNRLKNRLKGAVGRQAFLSHARIIEGDIRKIQSDELLQMAGVKPGELTVVAGGPPCQPFSRAGKRETVEAEDGRLFLEFVRVVRDTRPAWFIFENVKGLAQSRTLVPYSFCNLCNEKSIVPFAQRSAALSGILGQVVCKHCGSDKARLEILDVRGGSLEIIRNEFQALGYLCYNKILNSADYGVPQCRERLFIVGSRDGKPFAWPGPTHYEPKKMRRNGYEQASLLLEDQSGLRPWPTVKDVLWHNGHPDFGKLDYSRAVLWVKNVVRPHAEPVCWPLDRPSPTVGAHQAAKLALAPDGVPEEQLARQQWHVMGRRQRDLPPVRVRHEYLADDELLLLQTFPLSWYLFGTRMERAFQIGNAVPPLLGKAVGRSVLAAEGIKIAAAKGMTDLETIL